MSARRSPRAGRSRAAPIAAGRGTEEVGEEEVEAVEQEQRRGEPRVRHGDVEREARVRIQGEALGVLRRRRRSRGLFTRSRRLGGRVVLLHRLLGPPDGGGAEHLGPGDGGLALRGRFAAGDERHDGMRRPPLPSAAVEMGLESGTGEWIWWVISAGGVTIIDYQRGLMSVVFGKEGD